uniref:Leucine-rich repeat-containing N-terminal plant-type domain-containing protein n=1 Tax=Arcella intermedia TaxID=1963864 RepID=A0A6B2LSU7_9EUKA
MRWLVCLGVLLWVLEGLGMPINEQIEVIAPWLEQLGINLSSVSDVCEYDDVECCDSMNQICSLKFGPLQISGTIPFNIGQLSQLKLLYLSNNQLGGTLPESIGNLYLLQELTTTYN